MGLLPACRTWFAASYQLQLCNCRLQTHTNHKKYCISRNAHTHQCKFSFICNFPGNSSWQLGSESVESSILMTGSSRTGSTRPSLINGLIWGVCKFGRHWNNAHTLIYNAYTMRMHFAGHNGCTRKTPVSEATCTLPGRSCLEITG